MRSLASEESAFRDDDWINGTLAAVLLRQKHTLPVMLAVYQNGAVSTSGLLRRVRGHPEAIINAIRSLEHVGVLSRVRLQEGRHPVETRLTPRGTQLIETPIYRWDRLLRKWNRASE